MSLIGHWVAADAEGAGTALPDRSPSAAHGTLTAGCTWHTVAGELAVRCPGSDHVAVPDHDRWTFAGDFTLLARFVFNDLVGQPAWIGQSQGGGNPKWAWYHDGSRQLMHWQTGNVVVGGSNFAPVTLGAVQALAVRRAGSAFTFFRTGFSNSSGTAANAFSNVTANLCLGWGGESFWDSDVSLIALRIDDTALSDAEIVAALAGPALVPEPKLRITFHAVFTAAPRATPDTVWLEHRDAAVTAWTAAAGVPTTPGQVHTYDIPIEADHTYEARARVTGGGYVSSWSPVSRLLVAAGELPPPAPTDLTITPIDPRVLRWLAPVPLPPKLAGYLVRSVLTPEGETGLWSAATPLHGGVWPHATEIQELLVPDTLAAERYTFFVKSVDTSGRESYDAASLEVDLGT